MNRREFIKRASAVLSAGAVMLSGKNLTVSADGEGVSDELAFAVGVLESRSKNLLTLYNEDSLKRTIILINNATELPYNASRQVNRADELIDGELLVAAGHWEGSYLVAEQLATPLIPFRTTITGINDEKIETTAGELVWSSATRPVDGDGLTARERAELKVGDAIEGSTAFDPVSQQQFVAMIGVVS